MRLKEKNSITLNKYYKSVNHGDFMAVTECLSENIIFKIPGNPKLLPFSGDWVGHDQVLKLFARFGSAFWIVGMSETRTITTENEVFSFNDEAFKVKSNGQYYRVGVLHKIKFDDNGLIESLTNVHDTYVAELAFTNKTAIVEPILSGEFVPGETELEEKLAIKSVKRFLNAYEKNKSTDNYISGNARLISPGDPSLIPFAGIYAGKEQVLDYIKEKNQTFSAREMEIRQIVGNNGSVVVNIEEKGTLIKNKQEVTLTWTALFQLGVDAKIGKITILMDTAALSKAIQEAKYSSGKIEASKMEKYNNLSVYKVRNGEVVIHSCMSPEEGEMVCSVAIETKNKVVIVDVPLLKPFAQDFRNYVDELLKPVDRIIISHSHPDHWFGLEYFKEFPVYALQETIDEIDKFGDSYIAFHHTLEGNLVTNEKVVPTNAITDFSITIDELNINLLKIINAEASFMLAVELPDISVLIAQDLIYNKVFLYNGEKTPNGELLHDKWIENLKILSKNNYKTVIPGHGEPTDSSIFVDVIEYIETEKIALENSKNGEELKNTMLKKYPDYRNPKMLDISSYFLFKQN